MSPVPDGLNHHSNYLLLFIQSQPAGKTEVNLRNLDRADQSRNQNRQKHQPEKEAAQGPAKKLYRVEMIVAPWPSVIGSYHPKITQDFHEPLFPLSQSPSNALCSSIFNSKFSSKASLKCCCTKNDVTEKPTKGFSVLASDCPWKSGSIWSTMALYMFNLHIPLGYGGLSIAAYLLDEPVLGPQTQAVSLVVVQMLELSGALFLLSKNIKPQCDLIDFFKANKISKERNWLLASALGFGFLSSLVLLTSLIADRLYGVKVVDNPIVKEILLSSNISRTAFILVDCVTTPVLEEAVYRGFLLTSLASTMKWQHAVIISSAIFSAAHFSFENFIQLFIVGCTLGCSYCWSVPIISSDLSFVAFNITIVVFHIKLFDEEIQLSHWCLNEAGKSNVETENERLPTLFRKVVIALVCGDVIVESNIFIPYLSQFFLFYGKIDSCTCD